MGSVQSAQPLHVSPQCDWDPSLALLALQLLPKSSPSDAPAENTYVYNIPRMHLPGLFW